MARRQWERGEMVAVERIPPGVAVRIRLVEAEVVHALQMVEAEERRKLVAQQRLVAVELHRACPRRRR